MSASHEPTASELPVPDKRFLRWMWRIAIGSVFVFSALTIMAHTPWGRPMLAMLSGVPGCPVGLDDVDGAALEKQRQVTLLTQNAASPRAEAVPAHGFELGKTTFAEASAWVTARAAKCELARGDVLLRCSDLKLLDGSTAYEVDLHSDAAGKLVAYDVSRSSTAAATANGWFGVRSDALTATLGAPDRAQGQVDTAWLAAAPFRQRLVEYRRSNYRARVTVTHLTRGGYTLREQYQWAEVDLAAL